MLTSSLPFFFILSAKALICEEAKKECAKTGYLQRHIRKGEWELVYCVLKETGLFVYRADNSVSRFFFFFLLTIFIFPAFHTHPCPFPSLHKFANACNNRKRNQLAVMISWRFHSRKFRKKIKEGVHSFFK